VGGRGEKEILLRGEEDGRRLNKASMHNVSSKHCLKKEGVEWENSERYEFVQSTLLPYIQL
jgi:hypothetical protein